MATEIIKAISNPLLHGTITGAGIITVGDTLTLTPKPNPNRYFSSWLLPKGGVSTDNPLVIITDGDEAGLYTANFKQYLQVIVANVGGGSVTPTLLRVKNTDTVTLVAVPLTGFKFVGWFDQGNLLSSALSYSFSTSSDRNIEPRFTNIETETHQVSVPHFEPTGNPKYTDTTSSTVIYKGWIFGATCRISKTDLTTTVIVETWATGAWADHLTLTYA